MKNDQVTQKNSHFPVLSDSEISMTELSTGRHTTNFQCGTMENDQVNHKIRIFCCYRSMRRLTTKLSQRDVVSHGFSTCDKKWLSWIQNCLKGFAVNMQFLSTLLEKVGVAPVLIPVGELRDSSCRRLGALFIRHSRCTTTFKVIRWNWQLVDRRPSRDADRLTQAKWTND